ncbi:hypothetical protein [Faecalispora anaeroviscerum]|uniref:hypothetical protein n=1 Tax=Faecalispora anaeroviscerum TaxID=2991836 RepID=UPI0024B87D3C|nr:hypothetical protein [Faecalispora anaeroviscerum]
MESAHAPCFAGTGSLPIPFGGAPFPSALVGSEFLGGFAAFFVGARFALQIDKSKLWVNLYSIKVTKAALLRANESALKMPADRRDRKTYYQMKLREWAFSMERLPEGFRLRNEELFPKRIPKVSFGRPLLTFVLSRK